MEERIKSEVMCKGPNCIRFIADGEQRIALSRYGHGKICSDCGVREAFDGDIIKAANDRRLDEMGL